MLSMNLSNIHFHLFADFEDHTVHVGRPHAARQIPVGDIFSKS